MTEHELERRRRRRWMSARVRTRVLYGGLVLALLLVAGVAVAVVGLGSKGSSAEDAKNDVGSAAVAQSDRTLALCGGSAGADVAKALDDAGLCTAAVTVKDRAELAGVPTTVTVTAGVNPDRLRQYATEVLAEYCGQHNGCKPDTGVLVPLVADWLRAHPPTQPKPTQAEVRAAVQFVMSQNPAAFKGDPGKDGTNGQDAPPVTDEQLAAQVAAYCDTGACKGSTGAQGVGVVTVDFRRDDNGVCRSYATLVDPADGSTKIVAGDQVNDLVCQPVTPTTTEEPPAGGGGGLLGGG